MLTRLPLGCSTAGWIKASGSDKAAPLSTTRAGFEREELSRISEGGGGGSSSGLSSVDLGGAAISGGEHLRRRWCWSPGQPGGLGRFTMAFRRQRVTALPLLRERSDLHPSSSYPRQRQQRAFWTANGGREGGAGLGGAG